MRDITREVRGFPEVDFRYLVMPTAKLPSEFVPIFAKDEDIQFQLALGESDAKNVVHNGRENFDNIRVEEWLKHTEENLKPRE